jgi:hypothetical protein
MRSSAGCRAGDILQVSGVLRSQTRFLKSFYERNTDLCRTKCEGRLRFRKRPSCFDGDKPNSVGLITQTATIIYLTQLRF